MQAQSYGAETATSAAAQRRSHCHPPHSFLLTTEGTLCQGEPSAQTATPAATPVHRISEFVVSLAASIPFYACRRLLSFGIRLSALSKGMAAVEGATSQRKGRRSNYQASPAAVGYNMGSSSLAYVSCTRKTGHGNNFLVECRALPERHRKLAHQDA
mmetsp:Transcript_37939/g.83280  ORF Transcript_37939/g.83280 Transcript_37939/m.83280 type:complete len:157 (+) Transcript_37939:810-1280(+)